MSKSQLTKAKLLDALERILSKRPKRISRDQKLSVKAVEEEAGLGDGSAYYYKDIVAQIKSAVLNHKTSTELTLPENEKITKIEKKLQKEIRLKEQYRAEVKDLKEKLAIMAAQHNQFALTIQQYQYRIAELESEIIQITS